jgi:hypothetical protein
VALQWQPSTVTKKHLRNEPPRKDNIKMGKKAARGMQADKIIHFIELCDFRFLDDIYLNKLRIKNCLQNPCIPLPEISKAGFGFSNFKDPYRHFQVLFHSTVGSGFPNISALW